MQMSRKLLLFFVLFLVLSCPSVGVANDKGKVKTIYTELLKRCSVLFFFVLFFFVSHLEKKTSVRGSNERGYDSLELMFNVFKWLIRGRFSFEERNNYLFFFLVFKQTTLRLSARLSPLVFSRKQKLVLHIIIFPVIIPFADRNKKEFLQQSHTCKKGKNIQNRT